MVYGFVKQSRGHVRLHSEVGAGSSVRIYLPRSARAMRAEGAAQRRDGDRDARSSARGRRDGETVLLVEDNEQVRRLGVSALENLGYRVLEAPDGPAALRLLDSADASRVDLLFTDVVLPGGMSGPELAAASIARRPGLPVLFTSGYTGEQWAEMGGFVPMRPFEKALRARASRARDPPVHRRSTRRRCRHACLKQS